MDNLEYVLLPPEDRVGIPVDKVLRPTESKSPEEHYLYLLNNARQTRVKISKIELYLSEFMDDKELSRATYEANQAIKKVCDIIQSRIDKAYEAALEE